MPAAAPSAEKFANRRQIGNNEKRSNLTYSREWEDL